MRTMALVLTAMLAAASSLPVAADEASDPAVPAAAAEPSAADAPSRDLVPCGCGGPKAIYAAKYGTVQPPIMQELANGRAAEDAASSPDQPDAAMDAGADAATDGGS